MCEPDQCRSGVFIVKFEKISHIVAAFPLLSSILDVWQGSEFIHSDLCELCEWIKPKWISKFDQGTLKSSKILNFHCSV